MTDKEKNEIKEKESFMTKSTIEEDGIKIEIVLRENCFEDFSKIVELMKRVCLSVGFQKETINKFLGEDG